MLSDADQEQLDRVIEILREVLGCEIVGVYLFGSAVLGGLRPRSDLDVPSSRGGRQPGRKKSISSRG